MHKVILLITSMYFLAVSGVHAAVSKPVPDEVRQALLKLIPGGGVEKIEQAPISGMFQFFYGSEVYYITSNGRYLFKGDILDLDNRAENISEVDRAKVRKEILDSVPEGEMISYGPADAEFSVTAFTDIDCPYCVKFHKQIPELNRNGIKVNYLAYPRSGPGTGSFLKYVDVWCNEDQQKAMDDAKAGLQVARNNCDKNPVADQFDLGQRLGVRGTPTLFLDGGEKIPGYMPAKALIKRLAK